MNVLWTGTRSRRRWGDDGRLIVRSAWGVGPLRSPADAGGPNRPFSRDPREPLRVFLWSRALIWIVGSATAIFEAIPTLPEGVRDPGWALSAWTRWDGGWFLTIARTGYVDASRAPHSSRFIRRDQSVRRDVGGGIRPAGVLALARASHFSSCTTSDVGCSTRPRRRARCSISRSSDGCLLGAVYSDALYLVLSGRIRAGAEQPLVRRRAHERGWRSEEACAPSGVGVARAPSPQPLSGAGTPGNGTSGCRALAALAAREARRRVSFWTHGNLGTRVVPPSSEWSLERSRSRWRRAPAVRRLTAMCTGPTLLTTAPCTLRC